MKSFHLVIYYREFLSFPMITSQRYYLKWRNFSETGPSARKVDHWGHGLARNIESLFLPLSLLLPACYNMSNFPHHMLHAMVNRLKSNETFKPGTETSKMGAKQLFPVLKVMVLYYSGQKLPHAENYSWFHPLWGRSKRAHLTAGLWLSQLLFYTLFFSTLLSYVFLLNNSFSIWGRKSCGSIRGFQDYKWKSKAPISNAVNNELRLA